MIEGAFCGPVQGFNAVDVHGYFIGCGAELVVVAFLDKDGEPDFALMCPFCDRQDLHPISADDPVSI